MIYKRGEGSETEHKGTWQLFSINIQNFLVIDPSAQSPCSLPHCPCDASNNENVFNSLVLKITPKEIDDNERREEEKNTKRHSCDLAPLHRPGAVLNIKWDFVQ